MGRSSCRLRVGDRFDERGECACEGSWWSREERSGIDGAGDIGQVWDDGGDRGAGDGFDVACVECSAGFGDHDEVVWAGAPGGVA